jgi:hypothetical protein
MIKFRPISHNVREFLPLLPDYLEKVSQDYLDSEYMRTEHQKYLFQRLKGDGGMIDKNVIARRLAQLEKNILKLRKLEEEKCP